VDPLFLIFAFIFGVIVGSFLNVVVLRFNSGTTLGGRSMCMSCGRTLTWPELIPIFSFMAQKGRCRNCHSKISWQYPLVEAATGILFTLIVWAFPPTSAAKGLLTLILLVLCAISVVITVYDIKHKIIPDHFSYVFSALAVVSLFFGGQSLIHMPGWSAILAGPILALPFALIWLVSKGTWMGLGDAKLVLGIGWLLGLSRGANALILAFWVAAAVSLAWIWIVRRKFTPRLEISFGPYLLIGMYIVLLFGVQVIDFGVLRGLW
jgi:prepilin signal peptidase PulO-like enzyme (type II secretory pathway)